jgi:hypothetical protein
LLPHVQKQLAPLAQPPLLMQMYHHVPPLYVHLFYQSLPPSHQSLAQFLPQSPHVQTLFLAHLLSPPHHQLNAQQSHDHHVPQVPQTQSHQALQTTKLMIKIVLFS